MAISFLISQILVSEVFIGKGSRVRPHLGSYLSSKFLNAAKLFAFKNPLEGIFSKPLPTAQDNSSAVSSRLISPDQSPKDLIKNIPLNQTGAGIYTKSNSNVSYLLIKEQEVVWEDFIGESKGKKIVLKIPKGEEKPNPELFDMQ